MAVAIAKTCKRQGFTLDAEAFSRDIDEGLSGDDLLTARIPMRYRFLAH